MNVVQEISQTHRAHDFRTTLDKPGRLNAMTCKYKNICIYIYTNVNNGIYTQQYVRVVWRKEYIPKKGPNLKTGK